MRLASGWKHSMVVTASGKCYVWGRGVNGEQGRGRVGEGNFVPLSDIQESPVAFGGMLAACLDTGAAQFYMILW